MQRQRIFELLVFASIALVFAIQGYVLTRPNPCVFYDGEGNELPTHAVQLLVRSQYVIITRAEADSITYYFHK